MGSLDINSWLVLKCQDLFADLSFTDEPIGVSGAIPPPPYDFLVPHDLTLMNDRNLVCVADRENGRIECFQTTNGSFVFDINSPGELGSHLYSASYTSAAGRILKINLGRSMEYVRLTAKPCHKVDFCKLRHYVI